MDTQTCSPEVKRPEPLTERIATAAPAPPVRLASLDAFRGFVMLLMISAGLYIPKVAANFKDSGLWQFLAHETEHASWRGCTLWDLIQPAFMFMVGVAVPFSIANRRARGEPFQRMFGHTLWRSFALVILGVFLASGGHRQTSFNFEIVLSQIGLGYPFLWLLAWKRPRTQFAAACLILLLYWAAFALYPTPAPGFDYQQEAGLTSDWLRLNGFEAHWEKNTNLATAFDRWFLNLFPREKPFVYNVGGYHTLNFIPSLATMIFGLLAGGLLRQNSAPNEKLRRLAIFGVAGLILGGALDLAGICPMVKRIWTPSFAIYSTGWTLLALAAFYAIIDVKQRRTWAFPFIVAGMNSIALYCMSMLMKPWLRERLKLHLGQHVFERFGPAYVPMLEIAAILILLWLISFWMYRRKIFLRL